MSQSMSSISSWLWLGVVFTKVTLIRASLLYPASSVLQLTASISVPVIDLPPQRRVGFDWGFQMNYDMPFNLTEFYSVPIWPTSQNVTKRSIAPKIQKRSFHFDFSLLDFYNHLEQSLESYGFHKSCLLLCICELVQTPFQRHETENFISELLNLFFRPAFLLKSNAGQKFLNKSAYIEAEKRGHENKNCADFYSSCDQNLLSLVSKIVMS